jgi:hypothetical protein
MTALILRIVIAIVCVFALNALLAPVLRLIGLPQPSADLETVIRIGAGLIALFYIIFGKWPTKGPIA